MNPLTKVRRYVSSLALGTKERLEAEDAYARMSAGNTRRYSPTKRYETEARRRAKRKAERKARKRR